MIDRTELGAWIEYDGRLGLLADSAASKRPLFEELYATKGGVLVHLDSRRAGVVVPAHLRERPQLVLHVGAHLRPPVGDLVVTDAGFEATLLFSRKPFRVSVPWASVYVFIEESADLVIWPDDVPPEMPAEWHRAVRILPAKPAAKRRLTN